MKLGEIQFFENITARESLFMLGETDFPAIGQHFFFLHFSETAVSFYPSSRKVFFNEIFHSGWWKRIFWLVETVFVCSEFSLYVETVTKINGRQYLKKNHILTNEN